ncbi:hypothetical protein [Salibaculum griseiflavum]|uniref:Rap1a immunity protein domain-containing protein n=1 Tax=Salibaculum griseiflavum TaxID=1914409 RepID=A0A2V1P1E2_9RHOB|nr:hypothetical protein [Salibaculum griseiflavum]PWG15764.1 hypothetical protein DFK10_15190 [Salibaculum griseiflavum]
MIRLLARITPYVAIALIAVIPKTALANDSFSKKYYDELNQLGLRDQGFAYAVQWAGRGSPDAEILVANSLIEGTGTSPNPMAAIAFACGDRTMSDYEIEKVVIKASIRLIGSGSPEADCSMFSD